MKFKIILSIMLPAIIVLFIGVEKEVSLHNNLRKVFKVADKRSGKYNAELENPQRRLAQEIQMLADPKTGEIPSLIRSKELNFSQLLSQRTRTLDIHTGNVDWYARGPHNVGGRTRALALDIRSDAVILAGGTSGGMWKSTDGGATWVKTTGASDLHSVTAIAQDPRTGQENTWYYSTGELIGTAGDLGRAAAYTGDGIYKSTDNGDSWTLLASTSTDKPHQFDNYFDYNWNVKVHPTTGDVYVASFGYIFRSQNGGSSWANVLGTGYSNYTDIDISPSGILFACLGSRSNQGGIYRSTNGSNWTDITPSNMPSNFDRIILDIGLANEEEVYFLASTPGAGTLDHSLYKYTYLSGDGSGSGGTWSDRSSNIPAFGGNVGNYDSQGSYNMAIAVHPNDNDVLYIGGTNIYRSLDGFASDGNTDWIGGYSTSNDISMYDNHHPDIHAFVFFNASPNTMLSGTDGGVHKTTDNLNDENDGTPVNWTSLNNGYLTTQAYALALDPTGTNPSILTGFQDNGTWSSPDEVSAADWSEINGGDGAFCSLNENGSVIHASSQNANIVRYEFDELGNFQQWTRLTPASLSSPLFINPFVIDPNNEDIMYLPDNNRIFRNTSISSVTPFNNSATDENWDLLSNTGTNEVISALDISKAVANVLYYGTAEGKVFKMQNAHTGSPSAQEITGDDFPSGAYVHCISVDPTDANKVFVVFSNYEVKSVFYSQDGGASWEDVSGNLEENVDGSGSGPSVRWIEFLDIDGDRAYIVATSIGVYSCLELNGSATQWQKQSADLIGNAVAVMVQTRSDGTVAVATHGNGVFSAKFSSDGVLTANARFTADEQEIEVGSQVQFTSATLTDSFRFEWSINPDHITYLNGTSDTSKHPLVRFDSVGVYSVVLSIENAEVSDVSDTMLITVLDTVNQLPENQWSSTLNDPEEWVLQGGWVVGNDLPSGSYSAGLGAITSTTASDGYAMFDSDAQNSTGGTITMAKPIDLSSSIATSVTLEYYTRSYFDSLLLEYSTDENNWITVTNITDGLAANAFSDNPAFTRISVAAADGSPEVWFRLRYAANPERGTGYAVMFDDFKIEELVENDLALEEAFIDYSSDLGGYYGAVPRTQLSGFNFSASIENIGKNEQTDVRLIARVEHEDLGNVFQDSSVGESIASGQLQTLSISTTYVPQSLGVYSLTYEVGQAQEDAYTANNASQAINFEVTDSTFSRAFSFDRTYAASNLGVGGEYAVNFSIPTACKASSAGVVLDGQTAVGSQFKMKLYSINAQTNARTLILSSEVFELAAGFNGLTRLNLSFIKDGSTEYIDAGNYTLALEVVNIPNGGDIYVVGHLNPPGDIESMSIVKYNGQWYYFDAMLSHLTLNVHAINEAPIADFEADKTTPEWNETVTFNNLSSINPNDFEWSFGGASYDFIGGTNQYSESPQVIFNSIGSFDVQLIATNDFASDTLLKSNYITVQQPTIVDLMASQEDCNTYSFSASFTDDDFYENFLWTFSDGINASGVSPTHTFESSGEYEVCLSASNNEYADTLCENFTIECDDISTNVKDVFKVLDIYPNPAKDHLRVSFTHDVFETLEFYNVSGKLIATYAINSQQDLFIDLSMYSEGVYILKAISKEDVYKTKFSIVR